MDSNFDKKPITPANLSDTDKISDKILLNKDINISIKSNKPSLTNDEDMKKEKSTAKKKKKKKKKNRCCHKDCNKKLGIVDWNCKCGLKFCAKHRFPCDHNCTFDWHKDRKDILDNALMSAKCDFKKIDIL